eukprot:snap_masked-scaffold_1-processed-gene-30.23-mRNA-1 protein AED:1.00 eAED:1.00 QI:0/0/0/0/1/1/2/0/63
MTGDFNAAEKIDTMKLYPKRFPYIFDVQLMIITMLGPVAPGQRMPKTILVNLAPYENLCKMAM